MHSRYPATTHAARSIFDTDSCAYCCCASLRRDQVMMPGDLQTAWNYPEVATFFSMATLLISSAMPTQQIISADYAFCTNTAQNMQKRPCFRAAWSPVAAPPSHKNRSAKVIFSQSMKISLCHPNKSASHWLFPAKVKMVKTPSPTSNPVLPTFKFWCNHVLGKLLWPRALLKAKWIENAGNIYINTHTLLCYQCKWKTFKLIYKWSSIRRGGGGKPATARNEWLQLGREYKPYREGKGSVL